MVEEDGSISYRVLSKHWDCRSTLKPSLSDSNATKSLIASARDVMCIAWTLALDQSISWWPEQTCQPTISITPRYSMWVSVLDSMLQRPRSRGPNWGWYETTRPDRSGTLQERIESCCSTMRWAHQWCMWSNRWRSSLMNIYIFSWFLGQEVLIEI